MGVSDVRRDAKRCAVVPNSHLRWQRRAERTEVVDVTAWGGDAGPLRTVVSKRTNGAVRQLFAA